MSIKGVILGDIAGSQYEFTRMRPVDLDWRNVPLFTNKCRFTDDTVMTLAAKTAILRDPVNPDFGRAYREFAKKYPNAGYGGMFSTWVDSPNPAPYNSFGNGSAMRCSFVGEYYKTPHEVFDMAKASANPTHNHVQGQLGAIVTAGCYYLAKETRDKNVVFKYANHYYEDVNRSLKEIRPSYRWDVTCQGSVPAAIRCVYEADTWEQFMRNVMSLPCDMDTLGAIGGGIASELYGFEDIDADKILAQYLDDFLLDIVYAETAEGVPT